MNETIYLPQSFDDVIIVNGTVYQYSTSGMISPVNMSSFNPDKDLNGVKYDVKWYFNDDSTSGNTLTYSTGKRATSYVYGWRRQGIIPPDVDNVQKLYPEYWVSPTGFTTTPISGIFFTLESGTNVHAYQCEYDCEEYIAPEDGIFRAIYGADIGTPINYTDNINIYSIKLSSGSLTTGIDQNGSVGYKDGNLCGKFHYYINDSQPYMHDTYFIVPEKNDVNSNYNSMNYNNYHLNRCYPLHVKKGDRITLKPDFIDLNSMYYDFQETLVFPEEWHIKFFFNGIFFPYEY